MCFIKQPRSGPTDALIPKESPTFPTSITSPTDSPQGKTHSSCRGTFFFFLTMDPGVPACPRLPGKPANPWKEGQQRSHGGRQERRMERFSPSLSPTQSTGEGPSLVKAALGLFLQIHSWIPHGITTAVWGQTQHPLVPKTLSVMLAALRCVSDSVFILFFEGSTRFLFFNYFFISEQR